MIEKKKKRRAALERMVIASGRLSDGVILSAKGEHLEREIETVTGNCSDLGIYPKSEDDGLWIVTGRPKFSDTSPWEHPNTEYEMTLADQVDRRPTEEELKFIAIGDWKGLHALWADIVLLPRETIDTETVSFPLVKK